MQYEKFIDSIAAFEKLGIESSWQTRDEKELAKTRVDYLSSVLKAFQPFPVGTPNALSINIEGVRQIKAIASHYSVEKVVLFPYFANHSMIPIMRVYGGDKNKFCEETGQRPLTANTEEYANMAQCEKKYGIILYESC